MNYDNQLILKQAEHLYCVKLVKENTKGGSGNKIFEVETAQDDFILRVSKFTEETKMHTEFELQWLDCLGKKSDNVAKPIRSVNNNLYEIVTVENQSYILCLFEKAFGTNPDRNNPKEFNENLFFNLGSVMGDFHKFTASYDGNNIIPEFQWDNDAYSWRGANKIFDTEVLNCERMLRKKILSLPIARNSYGIIHYDIHIDNFFVENGKIKVFDFCDCQFNWYAADIASAIFFMVQKGAGPLSNKCERERTEFAEAYITSYLKGYCTTNTISKFWINSLDLFIKYQMTDEYRASQSYWKEAPHLQSGYMKWHKDRIINDLPYVIVNYDKIIDNLPSIPDM